jgi:ubiquinone/menaquinone biosynthesis C-methylase UbiE
MTRTALVLFGGLANSYEKALDFATLLQDRYWKRWVTERVDAGEGDHILDIGCGTLLLEERLHAGARVVGLDLTEEMIRVGQAKRLPNVALLVRGDAEALPVPEESFDCIVSCYVAKYVDLEKFVGELGRAVKPEGRVVIYDFVRPRGPFFPFLRVYLHGVLRAAGFLLGLVRNNAAFTLTNLSRIVEGAKWDGRFVSLMEAAGFKTLAFERLTGGVVAGYSGIRTGRGRT